MSARDRLAEMERFSAMFDAAENEEELIRELGTPTKQAIAIARSYEPSAPGQEEAPETPEETEASSAAPVPPESREPRFCGDSAQEGEEDNGAEPVEAEASSAPRAVFGADSALSGDEAEGLARAEEIKVREIAPAAPDVQASPNASAFSDRAAEASASKKRRRRANPAVLIIYILLSLLIGLPIAVLLIFIGVPFIALGGGCIALCVWALLSLVSILGMVSDIVLVCGAAAIIIALSVLLVWLGLWISLSLGGAWIGGVIFRLGGRLCFKKEAD